MPDSLPVPGAAATPSAPTSVPAPGGSVSTPAVPDQIPQPVAFPPPPSVRIEHKPAITQITINGTSAARISPRLAGMTSLTALEIEEVSGDLIMTDVTLPDSLFSLLMFVIEPGPWLDAIIAALPDRSGDGSGSYNTDAVLTSAQITALEAKGFFSI